MLHVVAHVDATSLVDDPLCHHCALRQNMSISILAHENVIHGTLTYTQAEVADGINVRGTCTRFSLPRGVRDANPSSPPLSCGLLGYGQNLLVCIEMFIAAIAHHKCYGFVVRSPVGYPSRQFLPRGDTLSVFMPPDSRCSRPAVTVC